jgi:negative regulator of flagellin synthesis FlgM
VGGATVPIARGTAVASKAAAAPTQANPSLATDAAAASLAPPIDAGRVAHIRQAIAEGSYRLEPARTADALIAGGAVLRRQK